MSLLQKYSISFDFTDPIVDYALSHQRGYLLDVCELILVHNVVQSRTYPCKTGLWP